MSPRERVCRAFRLAYEQAGMTQEALAEATGIRQATISKYARGEVQPPLDVLEKVEAAVGKPAGHILRLAGYVDDGTPDLAAAIERDGTLDGDSKGALLMLYRALVKLSTPSDTA